MLLPLFHGSLEERDLLHMEKPRITQLDGVRALAIGAVFLHHAFHVKLLWMGVDLFFILSGFLITGILIGKRNLTLSDYFGHFYERRARRILPPYLLFLVVVSLLFGFSSWAHHWYLYLFLMNLILALHVSSPEVMEILWSLAVEEQFYLFWPFIVRSVNEVVLGWIAGSLLVLVPLLRWFCTPLFSHLWVIYAMTPFRMDCLAAGALLAVISRRRPDFLPRWGLYGLFLSMASLVGFFWLGRHGYTTYGNTRVSNTWVYVFSLWACLGVMTWALSGRFVGILKWKPAVFIGRISYSIYLIHVCCLKVCAHYFSGLLVPGLVAGALSVLYATASWYLVEKPILGSGGKKRAKVPSPPELEKEPA
jgi:peptidoglycan/LPS O-acetylase OafA/YrhL